MVVDSRRREEGRTDLLFKALGDTTRRDILGRVGDAELSVSALARLHPFGRIDEIFARPTSKES